MAEEEEINVPKNCVSHSVCEEFSFGRRAFSENFR